jgi:hypothetical protein
MCSWGLRGDLYQFAHRLLRMANVQLYSEKSRYSQQKESCAARQDRDHRCGSHSPHAYASVRGQDVPTMKNVFCGNTCRASALLS